MLKSRAFTMVELIFVIVILGILSAVAVPKINASRDDARFAVFKFKFLFYVVKRYRCGYASKEYYEYSINPNVV